MTETNKATSFLVGMIVVLLVALAVAAWEITR